MKPRNDMRAVLRHQHAVAMGQRQAVAGLALEKFFAARSLEGCTGSAGTSH
jgi:hypothetical protein